MGAKIADLRDAVVTFINGESYSQSFTATAANIPTLELESTNDVVVTVFPGEFQVDIESRNTWQYQYTVHIAIQKTITAADRMAEEDTMLLLAEEIEDSLKDQNIGRFALFNITATAGPRLPFMAEQLASAGHFTAILEAVYIG
jgi:hypothetical protein